MLVLQSAAADKIADDDAVLSFFAIFEPHGNHSMSGWAAPPPIVAIFFADLAHCNHFEVTICTHIVVAVMAF